MFWMQYYYIWWLTIRHESFPSGHSRKAFSIFVKAFPNSMAFILKYFQKWSWIERPEYNTQKFNFKMENCSINSKMFRTKQHLKRWRLNNERMKTFQIKLCFSVSKYELYQPQSTPTLSHMPYVQTFRKAKQLELHHWHFPTFKWC